MTTRSVCSHSVQRMACLFWARDSSTATSTDSCTRQEIDHTCDRTAFTSSRVHRSAECPANTDHRLLIAKMKLMLHPAVHSSNQPPKYDTLSLVKDYDLAQRYSVDISNRFQALSLIEEYVESQWAAISFAIKKSADVVVGRKKCARLRVNRGCRTKHSTFCKGS